MTTPADGRRSLLRRLRPPIGADPSAEEIYDALSIADLSIAAMGRRRFLQGALAVGGAAALATHGPWARLAAAATPLAPGQHVLVVVTLGGGNDGLNTVVPVDDPRYAALRGSLSVAAGAHRLGDSGLALHPALRGLAARYAAGDVAVVRGVGHRTGSLSHFASAEAVMAGSPTGDRRTGWLGRYLDTLPDADAGLRGVALTPTTPLLLVGERSATTSLAGTEVPYGYERSKDYEAAAIRAIEAYGARSTGRGRLADALGTMDRMGMQAAADLGGLFTPDSIPQGGPLTQQLVRAAQVVNLGIGVRVLSATHGSYDTHVDQLRVQDRLLTDLDAAIDGLFTTLRPEWRDRVVVAVVSEFGRRAAANGSGGTDHGTAGPVLVVGSRVRGGLHGTQPRLDLLDRHGNMATPVDVRAVYASLLSGVLGVDPVPIVGGGLPDLGLLPALPVEEPPPAEEPPPVPTTPPPPADPRWVPFPTATRLVEQQYVDFLGRTPDAPGVAFWADRLEAGRVTPASLITNFQASAEFGEVVGPAARLSLAALGRPPRYDELMARSRTLRRGTLADVAEAIVASEEWAEVHRGRTVEEVVATLWRTTHGGAAPPATWRSRTATEVTRGERGLPEVLLELSEDPAHVRSAAPSVLVCSTYAGLLRRRPEASGFAYWVGEVTRGLSITSLTAKVFASAEYRQRFA